MASTTPQAPRPAFEVVGAGDARANGMHFAAEPGTFVAPKKWSATVWRKQSSEAEEGTEAVCLFRGNWFSGSANDWHIAVAKVDVLGRATLDGGMKALYENKSTRWSAPTKPTKPPVDQWNIHPHADRETKADLGPAPMVRFFN